MNTAEAPVPTTALAGSKILSVGDKIKVTCGRNQGVNGRITRETPARYVINSEHVDGNFRRPKQRNMSTSTPNMGNTENSGTRGRTPGYTENRNYNNRGKYGGRNRKETTEVTTTKTASSREQQVS